jgi:hypothetical protein
MDGRRGKPRLCIFQRMLPGSSLPWEKMVVVVFCACVFVCVEGWGREEGWKVEMKSLSGKEKEEGTYNALDLKRNLIRDFPTRLTGTK